MKDTTKPMLMQWFVDYEQPPRLMLVFSEPVRLLDCAAISFNFSSGFNFSFSDCSAEYLEYGTIIVFRLLDDGILACEAQGDTEVDAEFCTYQLGYSVHSAKTVAKKFLQQQMDDDPAFLSIAEGALVDYAETPNYSAAITSVAELGPGMLNWDIIYVFDSFL